MNLSQEEFFSEIENLQLEKSYIDPSLHSYFETESNLQVTVKPYLDDRAQKNFYFNPAGQNGISLSVTDFVQAPHFTYFIYDHKEPKMVVYDDCLVCHAKTLPVSCLVDQNGERYMTIGLCPDCGFIQQSKRPPREWYADFYRKQWDPKLRMEENWPTEIERRGEMFDRVKPYLREGSKILEIGGGWGGALATFKHYGKHDMYGIEATAHRSEFIRKKLGIPCFTGEGEKAPIGQDFFIPGSFDLIYSFHVLEHVYNAREVIEHLYCLLKDDGMAMISVPNYYQENLTQNTHDMSHTCCFSNDNFYFLLQTIGFEMVEDFSTTANIMMLVRKAQPLTKLQRQEKLSQLKTYLPYRGLAYILEKNGLARLPKNLKMDLGVHTKWFSTIQNQSICFVDINYNFLRQFSPALDALRDGIAQRVPIDQLAPLLPVQYVYKSDGVPIWYY